MSCTSESLQIYLRLEAIATRLEAIPITICKRNETSGIYKPAIKRRSSTKERLAVRHTSGGQRFSLKWIFGAGQRAKGDDQRCWQISHKSPPKPLSRLSRFFMSLAIPKRGSWKLSPCMKNTYVVHLRASHGMATS